MKKKTVRLCPVAVAIAAAIVWMLLPLFWKPLCELVRECGVPLATYGKTFAAMSLATGMHMVRIHLHTIGAAHITIVAAANGIMMGIAVYALAVCSKKWKAAAFGWGLCCIIAAALCKLALDAAENVSILRCFLAAFPFFYYPVAGIAAAVATAKRYNWSLGGAVMIFWIWCACNAMMFPLSTDTGWGLLNTPAQTIATVCGLYSMMPQAVCRTLVIGVNGIFYALGFFVFLRMSVRNKLIAGGLFLIVSCMAGLLASPPYMVSAATLMLLGIALSGCFVLGGREYEIEDDDETPSPSSVTYVNMVMNQEKLALDPDKTTFFHIDETDSWGKHEENPEEINMESAKKPEPSDADNHDKTDAAK
ncbi:MAG: hypothetical protein PHI85_07200 [Victivallaceae bacterium]|nr:hypothetical protein [Victivallaceae bacterium]